MSAFRSATKPGATRHSFPQKPRGLFVNGVWQSSAVPGFPHFTSRRRRPALIKAVDVRIVHSIGCDVRADQLVVYTCQKQQDDVNRCRFFLWDDNAKLREERALLNNSRSEPEYCNLTPSKSQRVTSPPPRYTVEPTPRDARRKGKRSRDVSEDEDEFGLDALDSISGDELLAMTAGETPSKATKQAMCTTPRRKLPWDTARGGIPTPQTESGASTHQLGDRLRATGELASPSRAGPDGSSHTISPAPSPFDTPTPSRFKNVNAGRSEKGLVDEVFDLLGEEKVRLDESASVKLRTLLGKHARRAEGNAKGKEVLRLHIKAEEAKSMELSLRNNTLQAELEATRATIDHLNWEKEHGDAG